MAIFRKFLYLLVKLVSDYKDVSPVDSGTKKRISSLTCSKVEVEGFCFRGHVLGVFEVEKSYYSNTDKVYKNRVLSVSKNANKYYSMKKSRDNLECNRPTPPSKE